MIHSLEDLKIVDTDLAPRALEVEAIGLSGGAERLYHLLALHQSRLRSAYLAGWGHPFWTKGDAKAPGSIFGADPHMDSADNAFEANLQVADLAMLGICHGVEVAFALNTREGPIAKAGIIDGVLPRLRTYALAFAQRGDDPDGDGISRLATSLCHEYALDDLIEWLTPRFAATAGPRPS